MGSIQGKDPAPDLAPKGEILMGIRIIVMIDTDHDDAAEAYRQVFDTMQSTDMEWESTDEWYEADGAVISETDVIDARCEIFTEMRDRPDLTCEHQPEVTGT